MRHYRYRPTIPISGKFFFSEMEIDFTLDTFPYDQFLIQEFFSNDVEYQEKIRNTYMRKYGSRSYAYLDRKYTEWRDGKYHLTREMRERILHLMPDILSERALKAIGLFEFSRCIKLLVQRQLRTRFVRYQKWNSKLSVNQWNKIVDKEFEEIAQIAPIRHTYRPLSPDDMQAAVAIAQYILQVKITKYAEQVGRDLQKLQLVYDYLVNMSGQISYKASNFMVSIDLSGLNYIDLESEEYKTEYYPPENSYQEYADKYFAYEISQIRNSVNMDGARSVTLESDLRALAEHVKTLGQGVLEASLSQTLQGEGGVFEVHISVLPTKVALSTLRRARLRLAFTLMGVALFSVVMILLGQVAALTISAMVILPWLLTSIASQARSVSTARKNIQENGKR